jgi:hypothetical protein
MPVPEIMSPTWIPEVTYDPEVVSVVLVAVVVVRSTVALSRFPLMMIVPTATLVASHVP